MKQKHFKIKIELPPEGAIVPNDIYSAIHNFRNCAEDLYRELVLTEIATIPDLIDRSITDTLEITVLKKKHFKMARSIILGCLERYALVVASIDETLLTSDDGKSWSRDSG
jgi:hypothetical protein